MATSLSRTGEKVGDGPSSSEGLESPYTTFTLWQQRTAITLVTLASMVSPLIAILYLPLLPSLAARYNTSNQAINLTITAYIVAQAIAPLLLATHSDAFGRRPVYVVSFTLATLASLGIALGGTHYATLIALRTVQSLGASAVLSVGYGVVADLRPPSTRGKVLGTVLAFSNLGTAVGPLIGGAIAYKDGDVRWAFWTMVIFCGSLLLVLLLLLPETARQVVGNGELRDRAWNQSAQSLWVNRKRKSSNSLSTERQKPRRKLTFRSPLQPILLMRLPDCAFILWIVGSYYALWYTVQASIPSVFQATPYQFNELQIGLCYLPGAAGVVLSMYSTGRIMDHNYRVLDQRQKQTPMDQGTLDDHARRARDRVTHDLSNFPIERARSRFCLPVILSSLGFAIGYGWSIESKLHPAVPLIFQFCMGFLCTWVLNVFNALLVDIFPKTPSTAATAGNLVRCGFSAAAVAVLDPLTKATNRGWFFTIMGSASAALSFIAVIALNQYGKRWRQKRARAKNESNDEGSP